MNIVVAVSGGADSLYALLALRERGHHVAALHARFVPPATVPVTNPLPGLTALCARLDIPLHVADLTAEFSRQVIEPFVLAHARALTPNPCALCNRVMKFGLLQDEAMERFARSPGSGLPDGADRFATGHYVDMTPHPRYGMALRAGFDQSKDQSYFLALTPLERLRRCVFPLAEERKTDIRAWLERQGVTPPVPGESQEICFVPRDDHRAFVRNLATGPGRPPLPGPGPVLLDDPAFTPPQGRRPAPVLDGMPIIGEHQGLWRYTEGQRKGLGLAWSEPLFVLRRDRSRNALVVGPAHRLTEQAPLCEAGDINLLVPPSLWPPRLLARIRYRQKPAPARVWLTDGPAGPAMRLRFETPQAPPAPGQVAAVYDEDGFVLAGGVLRAG